MTSLEYTQGFHDGLIEAAWQCLDCGNTYQAGVENCPNDLIDQAAAQLKAARWRLENAPAPQTDEEPRVQHHDEATIKRWATLLDEACTWRYPVMVVMDDRTVEGQVERPHGRPSAEHLYTVAGVTINARFPSERIRDIIAVHAKVQEPEEPPVGSVVRCEDCFVTFFRWTDGWFADDGVSITWDRIIGSGDPITVVYRPTN